VRRAELHLLLSRLPHFAKRVGVVLMGTSEGAMTVTRFDDQKYGRMIVGRIIASYACEYNYMHSSPEHALFGGQLEVPTLNLIGTEDPFFGPPAHGDFEGSCAWKIAQTGWGATEITGTAYKQMLSQGIMRGLVTTFPGAGHDITLTHNHGVRDVLLDFLQRPSRCYHLLHNWVGDVFLESHCALLAETGDKRSGSRKNLRVETITDQAAVEGQRIAWISCAASVHVDSKTPHTEAVRQRRLLNATLASGEANQEYLQMHNVNNRYLSDFTGEFIGVIGQKAVIARLQNKDALDIEEADLYSNLYAGVEEMVVADHTKRKGSQARM